jgi:hypothetical protein
MSFLNCTTPSRKWVLKVLLLVAFAVVWMWVHQSLLSYGTDAVPLHKTFIGDEQSPVNAGLHILKDKNPLAIRESGTYYGPVMAMLSVPAAIGDFAGRYLSGEITSAEEYQNILVWDWGGILYFARVTALLAGLLGIYALFLIVREVGGGGRGRVYYPAIISALLLATNLIYFEYSAFFRVWVFIGASFLWQFYITILIGKRKISRKFGFFILAVVGIFSFGLNYVSIVLQVFLVPFLFLWFKNKNRDLLFGFVYYCGVYLVGSVLIVAWYPHAFFNIFQFGVESQVLPDQATLLASLTKSILYYGQIFVVSSLPLLGALLFGLVYTWKKLIPEVKVIVISLFITSVTYFLLILSVGWTEGRYILPVCVCVITCMGVLLTQDVYAGYFGLRPAFVQRIVTILIIVQISLGMIGTLMTARSFEDEPSEVAVIENLDADSTIVVIRPRFYGLTELVGVAHTQESYEAYFASLGLEKLEYYQYLLSTNPPVNQKRYNIYYTDFDKVALSPDMIHDADYFVFCSNPIWQNITDPDPFNTNFFQYYHPQGMKESCSMLH